MPAWLLRLWDSGAESVMANGPGVSKLASVTIRPALTQRLYAAIQYTNKTHLIIDWLMVACHMAWPNKSDISLHTSLWSSVEDLQGYVCELGIRGDI